MFEPEIEEKVVIETPKKPFIVCGLIGVFWNIYSGLRQPVKAPSEEKVPPEAKNEPFCDRNTCTTAAAPAAEKKVLLEKFEHLVVEGSRGASRKIHYGPEDHLGSTRMVLDQNGQVKEALMYQPYGTVSNVETIGATATDPLRQKFTTKEFDEEGVLEDDAKLAFKFDITIPSYNFSATFEKIFASGAREPFSLNGYGNPTIGYHLTGTAYSTGTEDAVESVELRIRNFLTSEEFVYNLTSLTWSYENGYQKTYTLERSLADIQAAISTSTNHFVESRSFLGNSRINAYHFGARMYDPDIGVFTSTDPMQEFFNSYSYVGGNPILFIDPNGLKHEISEEEWEWRNKNDNWDPDHENIDAETDRYYAPDQYKDFYEINQGNYYRGFDKATSEWNANLYSYNGKPVAMYFPYKRGGVTNCVGYALFGSGEFQPSWGATLNEALAGAGYTGIDLEYAEKLSADPSVDNILIYLYKKQDVEIPKDVLSAMEKNGSTNIELGRLLNNKGVDFHGLRPSSPEHFTYVRQRWTQNLLIRNGHVDKNGRPQVPIEKIDLSNVKEAFPESEFISKTFYYKR